jgi:hypothetical protein
VFEYSNGDFFECQNIVEQCWFSAFLTQFCLVFECQKFRCAEFLVLGVSVCSCGRFRDFFEAQCVFCGVCQFCGSLVFKRDVLAI